MSQYVARRTGGRSPKRVIETITINNVVSGAWADVPISGTADGSNIYFTATTRPSILLLFVNGVAVSFEAGSGNTYDSTTGAITLAIAPDASAQIWAKGVQAQ